MLLFSYHLVNTYYLPRYLPIFTDQQASVMRETTYFHPCTAINQPYMLSMPCGQVLVCVC